MKQSNLPWYKRYKKVLARVVFVGLLASGVGGGLTTCLPPDVIESVIDTIPLEDG